MIDDVVQLNMITNSENGKDQLDAEVQKETEEVARKIISVMNNTKFNDALRDG